MKREISHSLLFIAALMLTCCATTRQAGVEVTNDTKTEVRYEYIRLLDTIEIEIPTEAIRNVTRDTVSTLRTRLATSTASIDTLGYLHHSLTNNQGSLPAVVEHDIEYRDSVVYVDKVRTETIVQTKEREKTWLEKTEQWGFWILLALLVLAAAYKVARKIYGK